MPQNPKHLKWAFLLLPIIIIILIILNYLSENRRTNYSDYTPPPLETYGPPRTPELIDCRRHEDCASRVCDFYKKDNGYCASTFCLEGDKASNNNFFCNSSKVWQASKKVGEKCEKDYECFEPTCFMIPSCDLTDIPRTSAFCKNNVCTQEIAQDECEAQGLKRILDKNEYDVYDGRCIESFAQRALNTVCAPCGNGVCEENLESECNCREDCAKE